MIRDVNFFFFFFFVGWGGVGAMGAGTWWCHTGYLNNLAGPILAKRCSICWGLLLHLPVNEHCCWRCPCVPCREASRQHLHLTLWPQRKMADVTDVLAVLGREPSETCAVRGPGCIGANNCHNMCLPRCTAAENKESARKHHLIPLMWPFITKIMLVSGSNRN